MKNIRIGNDIPFSWTIKRNGAAEDLSNVSCQVKLLNAYGVECEIDNLSISGNKIEGIFRGKHQEKKGVYTLKLIENGGQNNMNTIDHVQCFNLVPHTKDEGGSDCSNLTTSTINITSDILAPANGADGVGIQSITTASSNISGDNNTLTIKLTDGSEYVWYVKNGKDGKDGTNGVGQKGEDGHTPIITSAEALDGSKTTIYADGVELATIKNGTNGSDYILTDADKAAIAALIQGGGYTKPNTGIPKTDLAADVQASLGKADTALQSLPNNLVEDNNYVHTDNNYTNADKTAVGNIEELSTNQGTLASLTTTAKTDLVSAINEVNAKPSGGYTKPTDGIPKTDLASSVQTSLGLADTAIQSVKTINNQSILGSGNITIEGGSTPTWADIKPTDGIVLSDLASTLQTSISRADEIYNDYINAQNLI